MHYIDVILVIIGAASLFAMSYFAFHLATILKQEGYPIKAAGRKKELLFVSYPFFMVPELLLVSKA